MNRPFVVAVTGGIGSGKTTVCNRFAERHGVPVVDADIAAREVVAPGEAGLELTVEAFGEGILDPSGQLDRAGLKRLVFADPSKRELLESILHPLIRQRLEAQVLALRTPYCLLCIPLLRSREAYDFIDRVLVVDCDEKTQIARVMARDDLTESEVTAIMRTQASRGERRAFADDILANEGDAEAIATRVDELHRKYVTLAGAGGE